MSANETRGESLASSNQTPAAVPTTGVDECPDCGETLRETLEGLACRLEESVCLYRILLPGHLRQSPNAAAER